MNLIKMVDTADGGGSISHNRLIGTSVCQAHGVLAGHVAAGHAMMCWNSRRRLLLITLLVAAAAGAGTLMARWRSPIYSPERETQHVALHIDPTHLDFGEVWETDQFEWQVPVRNSSSEPIRAVSGASSCACASATPTVVIPPGGTAEMKFRIDLRPRSGGAEPTAVRDTRIKVSIGIDLSVSDTNSEIELRGRVRKALVVATNLVDLGCIPPGGMPITRVIAVRPLMALSDLTATPDDEVVRCRLAPTNTGWDLSLTPIANLPPGNYKTTVRLQPTLASNNQPPAVNLSAQFDLLGDIQPDSSPLVLGTHTVGSNAEGRITLRSLSGRPFVVEKWTVGQTESLEVAVGGAESASCSFTVRHKVRTAGDQHTNVRFEGKDGYGQWFQVVIEVRCYGLQLPE